MKRRRGPWCLAILAALLGAPSVALAAAPNTLAAPAVAPPAGSTATTFGFSVSYHSSGGNPAGSVSASVAGRTLSMSLAAGTPVSGTWTAASVLPAGAWRVTFRAFPSRGPQPTLEGPTVSVFPVASTTPAPTPSAPPGSQDASANADADPASVTSPAPTGEPLPVASPAPSSQALAEQVPGSTAGEGSAAPPPAAPAGSGSSGAVGPPARVPSSAAPGAPHPGTSEAAAPGASRSTSASRGLGIDGLGGAPLAGASELVWLLMGGGLIAVAVIALLGTAWLLLARRRREERPVARETGAALRVSPDDATRALLDRRSRRRARIRETDDPVLASMGLDEPGDGAGDGPPRAAQVHRGPGERDVARARRRAKRRDEA